MLPGIHAEAMFYKGLLAKLGVEADFMHIGAYKGAAESLTREGFSEPVRENMNALVDSLYDEMITTIVKDRPLSIAQAKEVIDTGIISAAKAKELGLIDRVAYPDEFREELAKEYDADSGRVRKELRQKGSRHRFLRTDGLREADAGDDGQRFFHLGRARQKDRNHLRPRPDFDRQKRKRHVRRSNHRFDDDHRSAPRSEQRQASCRDRAAHR